MRASVCVPVWDCSCYLIEAMVITFKLLSSYASLVFVRFSGLGLIWRDLGSHSEKYLDPVYIYIYI